MVIGIGFVGILHRTPARAESGVSCLQTWPGPQTAWSTSTARVSNKTTVSELFSKQPKEKQALVVKRGWALARWCAGENCRFGVWPTLPVRPTLPERVDILIPGYDTFTCNVLQVTSAVVSEALQLGVGTYLVHRLIRKYPSFEMPRWTPPPLGPLLESLYLSLFLKRVARSFSTS